MNKLIRQHKASIIALMFASVCMLFAQETLAGTDGSDFDDIWTKLAAWSQGSLGKVIAMGAFIVGLAIGVIQQTVMAVVVGVAMALSLYYGPTIIGSVVSALI